MRAAIQRVREAVVAVDDLRRSQDHVGLDLMRVAPSDSTAGADWLAHKIVTLRIFDDGRRRELGADTVAILAVSQFTLHASTKKGARPSYSGARRRRWHAPCLMRS
jgi:D-tyrosyl-tRNA(Tyr) deacylase